MTKCTTVLASLLRHLSRSDFEKAVKSHQADKGVRTLSTFDFFKQMVYGRLSGCFSAREIETPFRPTVQNYTMPACPR
jgi:hypothetical protein